MAGIDAGSELLVMAGCVGLAVTTGNGVTTLAGTEIMTGVDPSTKHHPLQLCCY